MEEPVIFIVTSDDALSDSIRSLVESAEIDAETFPSLQAFLAASKSKRHGCLVLDAESDRLNDWGVEVLFKTACAAIPAIVLADRGDVTLAVHALKAGAIDVVQKPYRNHNLLDSINSVLRELALYI